MRKEKSGRAAPRPAATRVLVVLVPCIYSSPHGGHLSTSEQEQNPPSPTPPPPPRMESSPGMVTGISQRPPFNAFSNQISCLLTLLTGDKLTPDTLVVLSHSRGWWWWKRSGIIPTRR